MRIMVFTEGTLLIHRDWRGLPREAIVRLVKAGRAPPDFSGSVPVGRAVEKLQAWARQGAELCYLTSRIEPNEVEAVQAVLIRFGFPEGVLYSRQPGQQYHRVAERVLPEILIEDDCESIGGEVEMTYPHISSELKKKIASIVVREFGGIDHLPDAVAGLAELARR